MDIEQYIVPDEDSDLTRRLINDAMMNARLCEDEELYFAYIKVIEEYIYAEKACAFRKQMIEYWKETEEERERNTEAH